MFCSVSAGVALDSDDRCVKSTNSATSGVAALAERAVGRTSARAAATAAAKRVFAADALRTATMRLARATEGADEPTALWRRWWTNVLDRTGEKCP